MSSSNANGISFGSSAGQAIAASYTVPTVPALSVGVSTGGNTLGNTGIYSGQVVLAGGNNVTLSVSSGAAGAQTITISAGAGGAGGWELSAGGSSQSSGTIVFSNSNNITFGLSTAAAAAGTLTASYSQSADTLGIYASSQTTGSVSSYTYDARSLSIIGAGAISIGNNSTSAGGTTTGLLISAPNTSSLVGAGGLSVSTNVSTISVYAGPITRMIVPSGNLTAISVPTQGAASIVYVPVDWPVTATRVDALVSFASMATTASAVTVAVASLHDAGIFTRNVSTLSSLSSGSTQTTYSYRSNNAGNTELSVAAIRPISVPMNVSMTPGEYFVAFNFSTATSSVGAATTSFTLGLSMMGGNQMQTTANYAEFGSNTQSSSNLYGGMGVYTSANTGISTNISLANIAQTGSSLSQANIALVFRNA